MKLGPFHFGYNATEDKGRRQAPQRRVKHEQMILDKRKRERLQATAQDQQRNHALVAWMVRKHLDYVSKFHISFRSDNPELNTLVNRIFKWHGAPRNFDWARRFGREEMFRLYELEKVVAGDAGLIKIVDGQQMLLQALESDLIANGEGAPDEVDDSGLRLDDMGRPTGFAVCKRSSQKPIFDHIEDWDNVIFDGYWNRFSSQYRGVSPLSTAINTVQDVSEAFEYNLIKAKMHALFGVAILRKSSPEGADFGIEYPSAQAEEGEEEDNGHPVGQPADEAALDPRSINMLDLEPDEDVKMIESNTPSAEFVEGSHLFIHIALLALDIPVTAFDSRRSSFSARIADLNEYEVSCDYKRDKNRYARQDYSDWVLRTIWENGNSDWPLKQVAERAQMGLREVQELVEWVPSGTPWLDKFKQVTGDQVAISLGLDNSIDAARRRGSDVFANIDKQKKVIDYAQAAGVPLNYARVSDKTLEELTEDEDEQL